MLQKIKSIRQEIKLQKKLQSKAQSVIIQFTLFFLIGLGIFITVGQFFRTQADRFREDVATASLKLSSSYLTSAAIASLGCIECDVVESKLFIGNATAGYFTEVFLSSSGIKTATAPPSKQFTSTMHNLKDSLQFVESQAPSIKHISLTFNRNQNKLEVSEA